MSYDFESDNTPAISDTDEPVAMQEHTMDNVPVVSDHESIAPTCYGVQDNANLPDSKEDDICSIARSRISMYDDDSEPVIVHNINTNSDDLSVPNSDAHSFNMENVIENTNDVIEGG